nr:MAG TPA: cell cycle inhibiting factor [Caudoviricetes sp.]
MRWKDAEIYQKDLGGGCIRSERIFLTQRTRNQL